MSFKEAMKTVLPVSILREDSWANLLTGLGTVRDKALGARFLPEYQIDDQTLENIYAGDDLAAIIVDRLPQDALKKGFKVTLPVAGDAQDEQREETEAGILEHWEMLEATGALLEACSWARLFGGGGVYLNVDDRNEAWEEIHLASYRKIRSLTAFDRRDLTPSEYDRDPNSERFGKPLVYRLTTNNQAPGSQQSVRVHWTRLVVIDGVKVTRRQRNVNNGWGGSILQRAQNPLRAFHSCWQAVDHRMTDASQGVFKIDGLINLIAGGDMDTVNKRLQVLDRGRSVARALVLDAGKESFEFQESTFAGVADILSRKMARLAAAAQMPITILFGVSPAGLNATGESDQETWADSVLSYQTHVVRPALIQLLETTMLALEGPTQGKIPDNWDLVFEPLRQMKEEQRATVRKTNADRDAIYISQGVLFPEEVALARFGPEGYSDNIVIDTEVRKAALEMGLEKIGDEPPPPPEFEDGEEEPPPPEDGEEEPEDGEEEPEDGEEGSEGE